MKEKQDYQGRFKGVLNNDWIAVKEKQIEPRKTAGLILPPGTESSLESKHYDKYPYQGRVVATGPGWTEANGNIRPMPCKVGDTIYVTPRNPQQRFWIIIDGIDYTLVRAGDVIYTETK